MAVPDVLDITRPIALEYSKVMNELWTAYLEIEKNDYIQEECYVEWDKTLFIVKEIDDIKNQGKMTTQVHLEHVMGELNDFDVAPFNYSDVTASYAIGQFLSGTTWNVGTVNVTGTADIKSDKRISTLAALQLMVKEFGGELDFKCIKANDGSWTRTVDFKIEIGNSTDKLMIRYDKNSDYMERRRNTDKLVTRLYCYGKNDLTFASINGGLEYIDSSHINDYLNIKKYTVYTNIDNKARLLTYGQIYLGLYEHAIYTYIINTMDKSVVPTWEFEIYDLGDTVRVQDLDLNINIDCRIKRIVKDLVNPSRMRIELANMVENVTDILERLNYSIEAVTSHNDYRALDIRDVSFGGEATGFGTPTPLIYIGGNISAGAYQGAVVGVPASCHAYNLWARLKTASTSNTVIGLQQNGGRVAEVTINAGDLNAETGIDLALASGDMLNVDIDSAGGDGTGLTVEVWTE